MNGNGTGKKTQLLQIKVSEEDKALVRQAANREQLRMTVWARAILLKKAQQVLGIHP